MLLWINLVWPILNLLPVFPLDGGQIVRQLCEGWFGPRGVVVSLSISIAVAALLALAAFRFLLHPGGVTVLGSPVHPQGVSR